MKKNCQELRPRTQNKPPAIAVSDARGVRSLHVGGEAIQSSMKIGAPFALALDYTRCMMAFLLFHPEPRRALMIGLGGGSLAKFFYKRLKKAALKVVELDARVLAAAREHFALPPDLEVDAMTYAVANSLAKGIVDDTIWFAVQERFTARGPSLRTGRPAAKYALTSIAKCGTCNGAIGSAR